jgi:hypothetical protein
MSVTLIRTDDQDGSCLRRSIVSVALDLERALEDVVVQFALPFERADIGVGAHHSQVTPSSLIDRETRAIANVDSWTSREDRMCESRATIVFERRQARTLREGA